MFNPLAAVQMAQKIQAQQTQQRNGSFIQAPSLAPELTQGNIQNLAAIGLPNSQQGRPGFANQVSPQQGAQTVGGLTSGQPTQTTGPTLDPRFSNMAQQNAFMQQREQQHQYQMANKPQFQIDGEAAFARQQQAQPQQQFGLSGAEQALRSGAQAGVSALGEGQTQALGTLQFGNQLAQDQLGAGRNLLLGGAQAGVGQIQQGLGGALGQLNQGQQALGGGFGASAQQVDPNTGQPFFNQAAQGVGQFTGAGLQAQGLQSALSGAQGQQAFNQALMNSPVQQFLREQGEQSVINQATATGGLGGGEVQKELTRFGQGLAGTQLQQQIQNLGALSGQGLQAAGQQGQFLSQAGQQQGQLAGQNAQLGTQASIASANNALQAAGQQAQLFGQGAQAFQNTGLQGANLLGQATGQAAGLFGQGAGVSAGLTSQGAGIQAGSGQNVANLLSGAGQNIADARFQTGRDLASQIGQSTSALSSLANQQGSGLADIIGAGGSNLANILSNSGQFDAGQQSQLAQLLANISTGQGTQLANIAQNQGNNAAQTALQAGANQQQLLGNLAGAYGTYKGLQTPTSTAGVS